MENSIYIRYDKFRNTEYISWKREKFVNDFGYTLLDFLYVDVKQRYYDIIKDATENNHQEVYEKINDLFNKNDSLLFKLFFSDDLNRFLEESNMSNYSGTFEKYDLHSKTYIEISDEKPFNSKRDVKIRKLLDIIELTQRKYSLILEFCSINTATTDTKIYNRYVNKFMYAAKRLLGHISKPKITFDNTNAIRPRTLITLEELEKDYADFKTKYQMDINPLDEFYYICSNINEYFVTVMLQVFDRQYIIPKCLNCGKYFIPFKKSSALYCDRISPQNPNKTCKEFEGSKPKGLNQLYRKIYQKKFARVTRNPNNITLKEEFDKWRDKAKNVKDKYNSNKITDEEYKEWLQKNDK